ncbi:MAG: hypothetical protein GX335_03805, partial [Firmicutes bacterium]|nr:hypothetical protein [Bacillota bacterium]
MRVQAKGCGSAPGSFLAGLGRVETVFPAAVNIRTLNGFCLSVVDERADLAPNRIILPLGRLKKLPFRPGQTVEIKAG